MRDTGVPASPTPTFSADNRLPSGTKLGEFEITGLVGEGGFGIVYLAYDHSLEREIALKEYMPSALAARTGTLTVSVKSERHQDTFQAGLKSFINEARLLARFDHASLVKVYRFWEANGTAYMVMPFYRGLTLKETLRDLGGAPDEAWLKDLLAPLIDALALLHKEQCFHRDIAPDNILILGNGRPLLLDFGAARRVIGDMTQVLTVILKPGYAPIEQYADTPGMNQGAWTDIYALASVIYFAIMGRPPLPSVARMMSDSLTPLSKQVADRYSKQFLLGIDKGLQIKQEDRPQNMAEFGLLLGIRNRRERERAAQPGLATQSQLAPAMPVAAHTKAKKPASVSARVKMPSRRWVFFVAPLLVLIIAAAWWLQTENQPTEVASPSQPAPPSTSRQAPVAPLPGPTETESTPQDKTPIEIPAVAAPAPISPFDPVQILDEVFRGRDRDHAVSVLIDKAQVRVGKDRFGFSIRSSKPGYVYLLMVGTNRSDFYRLFPNAIDADNKIDADKPLALPRKGWHMTAQGPTGIDHFVAIVSDQPRDFSAAGLKERDSFAEFPPDTAALYRSYVGTQPLFAGKAICTPNADCSQAYGAAVFSIEEIDSAARLPGLSPQQASKRIEKHGTVKPLPRVGIKEQSRPVTAKPDATKTTETRPGRCSDLLLRASLGDPLTSEEQATLRKDCK